MKTFIVTSIYITYISATFLASRCLDRTLDAEVASESADSHEERLVAPTKKPLRNLGKRISQNIKGVRSSILVKPTNGLPANINKHNPISIPILVVMYSPSRSTVASNPGYPQSALVNRTVVPFHWRDC